MIVKLPNERIVLKTLDGIQKLIDTKVITNNKIILSIESGIRTVRQDPKLSNKETQIELIRICYTAILIINKDPAIKKEVIDLLEMPSKDKKLTESFLAIKAALDHLDSFVKGFINFSPTLIASYLISLVGILGMGILFTAADIDQEDEIPSVDDYKKAIRAIISHSRALIRKALKQ